MWRIGKNQARWSHQPSAQAALTPEQRKQLLDDPPLSWRDDHGPRDVGLVAQMRRDRLRVNWLNDEDEHKKKTEPRSLGGAADHDSRAAEHGRCALLHCLRCWGPVANGSAVHAWRAGVVGRRT